MKVIDVHSHIVTPEYHSYIEKNGGLLEDSMTIPVWDENNALAFMDDSGIDWSLLSVSSPHAVYRESFKEGIEVCRKINETTAAVVQRHPKRFRFTAIVPLPDVDAAIEEAEYALDELGASGIKLASNARGQYLGDPELEPFFAFLNERKTVVNIHPHRPEPLRESAFSAHVIPLFEFLCDTTRTVLDMIGNGITERYPDIRIIVPHCGSFLPNIADRAQGLIPLMNSLGLIECSVDIKTELAKLYYDTSGSPVPNLLPLLFSITSADHILYGSDYPFTPAPACKKSLTGLSDFLKEKYGENQEMILYKNAETLFGGR